MKVIGSRSRSRGQKSVSSQFLQCKTLISNNNGSIVEAMKSVCSMGFWAMADQIV